MVRTTCGACSMLFNASTRPSVHGWKLNKNLTTFLLGAFFQLFGLKTELTLHWCAASNSMSQRPLGWLHAQSPLLAHTFPSQGWVLSTRFPTGRSCHHPRRRLHREIFE